MLRTIIYHYYGLLLLLLVLLVPVCMAWGSHRHAQQKRATAGQTLFTAGPAVAAAPATTAIEFPSVLLVN